MLASFQIGPPGYEIVSSATCKCLLINLYYNR